MLLYEIVDAFQEHKVEYAIVGGYALALQGLVRATMDVDLVIRLTESGIRDAEKALNEIGLKSRLPVRAQDIFKMRKEFVENRNLVSWSFVDFADPTRQVDILLVHDVQKIQIEKISVAGRKIVVANLEALLKMKKEAGRPQDLVDVLNLQRKLDEKKKK